MSKRTRILVDPTVQWSIAFRIIIHWCLLVVCLVMISVGVRMMVSVGNQPFIDSFWDALLAQGPVLGVMFVLMPVFLRDTLKLSNRFAGPMFRLRTVLREMADGGDGRKIKFRTGDFWLEAADDFNHVHDQIQQLKARNRELEAELELAKETTGA